MAAYVVVTLVSTVVVMAVSGRFTQRLIKKRRSEMKEIIEEFGLSGES